ncbi:MAG: hypothetical protein INF84_12150 [Roseomonas sp.]|nr:hypothetical protein [Roseomonas sp.]
MVVDVMTGELTVVDLTPEEIAALPPLPPPVVPREVTNFQARALLMNMPGSADGRSLFQDVDDKLRALGGVEWQAWEYTTIFPRNSQLIATLAAQLGLTDAQLDQMFIAAAAIGV